MGIQYFFMRLKNSYKKCYLLFAQTNHSINDSSGKDQPATKYASKTGTKNDRGNSNPKKNQFILICKN